MWKNLWPLAALVAHLTAALPEADNSSPERLAAEKPDLVLADSVQIQGIWGVAALEVNSKVTNAFPVFSEGQVRIQIQAGHYFNPSDPDRKGGQYALEEDQWPHRATLTWLDDDPPFRRPGDQPVQQKEVVLYELNGDTLRICTAPDRSCPKQFNSNGGQGIWILKREKKPDKFEEKKHR
jgi:uncharacterized protein (TIGR03067 family)